MTSLSPSLSDQRGFHARTERALQDLAPVAIQQPTEPLSLVGEPGAYLLFCFAPRPVKAEIPSLGLTKISAGRYIYAGSAFGPGGLSSRIARHFKRYKKIHWHIDHLTCAYPPSEALAFPHRTECELVSLLCERMQATLPIKGFGSSDCPRCHAHLLQLPS